MNSDVEQRIKQETAKVKADSYQKIASIGGWMGGGRTLWAISTVGAVIGAAIGVLAPFFPMIALGAAALPSLATIGSSVAIFAATGMLTGFSGGLVLGRISGAGAAIAQEQEKRLKDFMVRQRIANNPSATIAQEPENAPETKKSLWQKISDGYHTYVNPRVGLAMAAIGAVGGLILSAALLASGGMGAFAVVLPSLETMTGIAGASALPAVVTSYTTGVMAAFGATFAFNIPKITSDVTQFYGRLIGGDIVGRKWEPPQDATKSNPVELNIEEKTTAKSRFVERQKKSGSFLDMAVKRDSEPVQPNR